MDPTIVEPEVVEAVVATLPLVSPQLILILVGGALVTFLAGLLKGPLKKLNTQYVVLLVAILLGVLYYSFSQYVPVEMQTATVNFVVGSLSAGVLIYEFIWKNLMKLGAKKK